MAFLIALLEHPVLFTVLVIGILVFIGQTYEFILYLFGIKKNDELTDDEREIFNRMKEVIEKGKEDSKENKEYIYDDNIKGVYE